MAPKSTAKLNVILGKSPGETLRKFGHNAYGLEAQRDACKRVFDRKYGKGKWRVAQWHIRDVSARRSRHWPKILNKIIDITFAQGATHATSIVSRMLSNKEDIVMVEGLEHAIKMIHDILTSTYHDGCAT